jgi:type IV pilus assembly protein PilC
MLFSYKVINQQGTETTGQIDAVNQDAAIGSLQRRGFIIVSIVASQANKGFLGKVPFLGKVSQKSIVMMSRQISALFDAQISALKAFTLMAENTQDATLKFALLSIAQDIQGGISISGAMEKHPAVFTNFYISMVRAGEESGKLTETFQYLADYLERAYELSSKTRSALIYPGFILFTFISVMVLMLTFLIPKLSVMLKETGNALPWYTKITIGLSDLLVNYGFFVLIGIVALTVYLFTVVRTPAGRQRIDRWKLRVPVLGDLFKKLYLSRIADNMDTMLSSGIPVLRTLELTGDVVDNEIFHNILTEAINDVKGGISISSSFEKHIEIPRVMVSMIRIGEETGTLGPILKKMAKFYKREVDDAVDTLIGLIEPVMIVLLGVGVGGLLTSVLIPIYNIAGSL